MARKRNTLVDAYKKVKDNNKNTGKGAMRFQFYSEMDDLLGGQHDGTSEGLEVHRPEALGHGSNVIAFLDTSSSPATTPATPPTAHPNPSTPATPMPPRQRRRVNDELMHSWTSQKKPVGDDMKKLWHK